MSNHRFEEGDWVRCVVEDLPYKIGSEVRVDGTGGKGAYFWASGGDALRTTHWVHAPEPAPAPRRHGSGPPKDDCIECTRWLLRNRKLDWRNRVIELVAAGELDGWVEKILEEVASP